jgi:cell division protein FtsQ
MNQSTTSTRPFGWEDTAASEPLFRRAQQSVSPGGRTRPGSLPGMPLEMADPDDEDEVRPKKGRFGGPRNPWWRPASTAGRVLLGVSLLTVFCGLTIAVLYLKNYLNRDGRFRIEGTSNIEATGLTEVSRKQMLPVFGEDIGRNIFFVPLSERRRELEEIPWVEHATVMRVLPDQIRVSLVERKPVAFVRQGNTIGLVDANGVLLSMPAAAMAQHHYSFPVVTGIDPADPIASRKSRIAVYLRMLAELDASNQHFSEQISEIDLTDPEDARVLMPEQGDDILAHFGEDKFADRYRRYKEHIAEWRKQYPRLASVDLRYDQQVVLGMKNAAIVEEKSGGDKGSGDKATTRSEKPVAAQNANSRAGVVGTAAAGAGLAAHAATNAAAVKPAAAKPAATDVADSPTANGKIDGKSKPGATSTAKPKTLTAKQKAVKEEAAREKALEAKAAHMRAAREKAAAAKQNKKPAAAQPAAAEINGQKTPTTPHSGQEGE